MIRQKFIDMKQIFMIDMFGTYQLSHFPDCSENVQLHALNISEWAIEYIQKPTPNIQIKVAKERPLNIRFIRKPIEEAQIEAASRNPNALKYIDEPTDNTRKAAAYAILCGKTGPDHDYNWFLMGLNNEL